MVYEPVFKKLPFYRLLTSVINTTLLSHPQRHSDYLIRKFTFSVPEEFQEFFYNTEKSNTYSNFEIQLRFCRRLSNLKSCHEIDDYIPPELEVSLNGGVPDLPPFTDSQNKTRLAFPIKLTDDCLISHQNQISISWFSSQSDNYEYFFTIHLVERISYEEIVKSMRISLETDSKDLIIKSLGGVNNTKLLDSDLTVTSLTVSLLCPLTMLRINVPVRSVYCTHVQCFDIFNYLQINEFKPTWKCPICADKAPFNTLMIDSMFKKILRENVSNEIVFAADGSWRVSTSDPLWFATDIKVENDMGQQTSQSKKSFLNRRSTSIGPGSCTQKRQRLRSKSRTPSKPRKASTPQSTRRRKQKLSISTNCISDIIKEIKYQNQTPDVIDLTLDSSSEF